MTGLCKARRGKIGWLRLCELVQFIVFCSWIAFCGFIGNRFGQMSSESTMHPSNEMNKTSLFNPNRETSDRSRQVTHTSREKRQDWGEGGTWDLSESFLRRSSSPFHIPHPTRLSTAWRLAGASVSRVFPLPSTGEISASGRCVGGWRRRRRQ